MDFSTALSTVYKEKYLTLEGRATRSEYWYGFLAYVLAYILAAIIPAFSGTFGSILMLIVVIGAFIPGITSLARRLHDTNRSGWWMLLSLIPFGILVVWYFASQEGTEGDNEYGPPASGMSADLSI